MEKDFFAIIGEVRPDIPKLPPVTLADLNRRPNRNRWTKWQDDEYRKQCHRCFKLRLRSYYTKDVTRKDGLYRLCKFCRRTVYAHRRLRYLQKVRKMPYKDRPAIYRKRLTQNHPSVYHDDPIPILETLPPT